MVMRLSLFDRYQAAVRNLTDYMLELQSGVVDAELLAKHDVDAVENEVALRRRNVGDGDVAGERVQIGAETPYMQVVNIFNAVDGGEGAAYIDE